MIFIYICDIEKTDMKQKITIYWLSIRLGVFFLLSSAPLLLSAQEVNDSTRVISDKISMDGILQPAPHHLLPEKMNISPLLPYQLPTPLPVFSLKGGMHLPYHTNPSPLFLGDYRTDGVLRQLSYGTLSASGGQTTLPGLGRINEASLGYQHVFNEKFSLHLQADALKINMPYTRGKAFSTSGAFIYRPAERLSFRVFGAYGIGNSYGMSTDRYGATMSVDMSERFGVEVGVQRYYNAMSRRWETVPMVIPYYHFNTFTLGFDVGEVIYEILRQAFFDKKAVGNPTIRPPHNSIPIR